MASTALDHILKRTVRVGNQAQVQVKGPSRSSRYTTTLLEHWVIIVAINKKIQKGTLQLVVTIHTSEFEREWCLGGK
jgi:hypothetical protein